MIRRIFNFSFAVLLIFSSSVYANALGFTAEDVIRRIELRRGHWIALQAEVELQFENSKGTQASCAGNLFYQRLEEAVFLECLNPKGKPVFIFKTTDRNFELYLPSRKSYYKGNIFSLEDSPTIESHLRPLDLYRSFKPMLISAEQSSLQQKEGGVLEIEVQKENHLLRKLQITNQGDILSETYFNLDGKPSVDITRADFQKIPSSGDPEPAFPHEITIASRRVGVEGVNKTFFHFKKTDFTADFSGKSFEIVLPEDTREIVLQDDFSS